MNQQAKSVEGVDVNLLLIDLTKEIMPQFANIEQHLQGKLGRTWVVFTKIDLLTSIEGIDFDLLIEKAKETIPNIERHFFVSQKIDRVHELTGAICDAAQVVLTFITKDRFQISIFVSSSLNTCGSNCFNY